MGLLGVARANTAVGVSPETFLLLLLTQDMEPWTREINNHVLKKYSAVEERSTFIERKFTMRGAYATPTWLTQFRVCRHIGMYGQQPLGYSSADLT
jgi:hypothetical protein